MQNILVLGPAAAPAEAAGVYANFLAVHADDYATGMSAGKVLLRL